MSLSKSVHDKPIEQDEQQAYDYALRLLTRREYSRRELYQKLLQRYVKELAILVLKRCIRANLQSDELYAQMLVRHMVYQGYGPLKFVQSCKSQGIGSDIYQALLEETDWLLLGLEVLQKKAPHYMRDGTKPSALDYTQKQKIMAMLYRRGFPAALITEIFEKFTKTT